MNGTLSEILKIKSSLAAMMATGLATLSTAELDLLKERLNALRLGNASKLLDSIPDAAAPDRFAAIVKLNQLLDQVELRLAALPQINREAYEPAVGYPNILVTRLADSGESPSYESLIQIREPIRKFKFSQ